MPDQGDLFLVFDVGELRAAIPLEHVSETMRRLPAEPLANMPPFVFGVSIIRGVPTPVLDGSALLSGATGQIGGRLIVLKLGDRRAALAVSSVVGIRRLPRETRGDMPPLLRSGGAGVVQTLGALDDKLSLVLNTVHMIPDDVWDAVDAREVVS